MPTGTSQLTPITLETNRMVVRPFSEADMTPRYLAWLNDVVTLRYSQQGKQKQDLTSCQAYRKSIITSGGLMLAMCVKKRDSSLHIGNLTLRPSKTAYQEIDISILIGDRSEWGRGYASEAWIAVCTFLFETRGIQRITAGTHHDNKAMRALMARTGMQPFEPLGDTSEENIYMALVPSQLIDNLQPAGANTSC